jgi:hypothetical protein
VNEKAACLKRYPTERSDKKRQWLTPGNLSLQERRNRRDPRDVLDDCLRVAPAPDELRIALEDFPLILQLGRQPFVIGIEERDPLAGGFRNPAIPRG